ncbi:hypothetical protein P8452_60504 [Trifolium repens]|nr:hypothetical protein P8452_54976 [Trifolium repens]WJX76249.1 hypothetical protein P8452_59689 [Trifolium repens]WJX77170.1 hypothetical protein P8452_60504 [Trifolium repens]
MGGSYAFMVPIISIIIIHDSKLASIEDPHLIFLNTMRAVQVNYGLFVLGWPLCRNWNSHVTSVYSLLSVLEEF